MFSTSELAAQLRTYAPPGNSGYLIGLSGGGDSAALLAAAAELRDAGQLSSLRAAHVDHGLQASAGEFRTVSARLCARFGVALRILETQSTWLRGESIEAFARRVRYAALDVELRRGECLLTAHHAEDQAETFLLQALRGAGVKGLAAMPVLRPFGAGWHLRPLLAVPRSDLQEFCAAMALEPCDDPMNADSRFDRVYLRHEIWPRLEARWPQAAQALRSAAEHAAEAQQLLEAASDADLAAVCDGDTLSVAGLRVLSQARRLAALRRWLALAGMRVPPAGRLREALRQYCAAAADKAPSLAWDGVVLRRFRDRLYLDFGRAPRFDAASPWCGKPRIDAAPATAAPPTAAPLAWRWRDHPAVPLGASLGQLRIVEQRGGLRGDSLPHSLWVGTRSGGERLRPARGARLQSVQHLFQARGVVPWMRPIMPFIRADDQLIAIGDFWLSADHCVEPGQPGLAFRWEHGLVLE